MSFTRITLENMSDFSIDYILNRAGVNSCITMPERIKTESNTFEPINYHVPMFDWLQYTRYKPPRLQSKCRHLIKVSVDQNQNILKI